jgi:hypothetical protein
MVEAAKDEGSSRRTESTRFGTSREGAEATAVPPVAKGSSKRPSGPRAGFWVRFDALLIDLVLLAAVTSTFIGIGPVSLSSWVRDLIDPRALLLLLAYFSFFEGSASGQTVGKSSSTSGSSTSATHSRLALSELRCETSSHAWYR